MQRLTFVTILIGFWVTSSFAQFPLTTLRQIQQVPAESLLVADGLQNNKPSRWTLQKSSKAHTPPLPGDTVRVRALCVVPAKVLTFNQAGYTMLLYDSSLAYPWGGIFGRVNLATDTTQAITDGILNVSRGDIVEVTGWIAEFPTNSMNSLTQFNFVPNRPFTIIASGRPIPAPIRKNVSDFYRDIFSGGTVRYSTGEMYEGLYVELINLQVNFRVNATRGTFSSIDAFGDEITMYDASKFFTLGHGTIIGPPDTTWQRIYPQAGTLIDTLRGFITTVSGSENPRGYRIAPAFRSDYVSRNIVLPSITQHRRNPIIVRSDSLGRISVRVTRQTAAITSVQLLYSINNGAFTTLPMIFSDTTYKANIPLQVENTFVKYFIKATDSLNNSIILANSAISGASLDTSKGFFFYTVLNRALTIQDIQSTPFRNGRSGYLGASVSLRGVVTADTAHIRLAAAGALPWYMQTGTAPWNGIWFYDTLSALKNLRNGDSITVTGTVAEQFDVTRLQAITSPPILHVSGATVPNPLTLTTGAFGPNVANGASSAEPYEGMLAQFNNVTVTDVAPIFSDPTEFEVDDGSGPILVRRDGTHTFSNVRADTILGRTILKLNDRISFLRGVIYFAFNRYKIVPRRNTDFGVVTGVDIQRDPTVPAEYALEQNYPNPFNPATVIEYDLPLQKPVTLKIYNVLGQEVRTLVNEVQESGKYRVRFDGASVATGVYFYRLEAAEFSQVRKMLLLK